MNFAIHLLGKIYLLYKQQGNTGVKASSSTIRDYSYSTYPVL